MNLAGRGIGIGGGSLNGIAAFDEEDLERLKLDFTDQSMILIRPDTVPDDIGMIFVCDGLITARGGATSHAAVTAARLGKTCVVNCSGLMVDEINRTCVLDDKIISSGDLIAIDGNLGIIYLGHYPMEKSSTDSEYKY
jgi:pyruvate,orthophosphate dikinase